ncbi:MAG: thiamine pyrophosphate-dependent enzyme, partial [Sandaracinaceae bacterium]
AVVRALPAGALLGLGNSLPIRHADRFVPGGGDLRVITQRGVNGIDGWIAGLAGSAQADGGPAACIVGDVTAAHDLSSLALLARLRTPAALVVIDNGGGRIFEQLPIAQDPGSYDPASELFTTPPAVRFERAAEAYGVRYEAAEGAGPARDALLRALEHGGATLVHVRVPPHGASEIERALREALK